MKSLLIAINSLMVFLLLGSLVCAQTGYRRDPWAGNRWSGPGAPPHWSPEAQRHYLTTKNHGQGYERQHKQRKFRPGHPRYYPSYHNHSSFFRGSAIYFYSGPGGWFISETTGIWGGHDIRRRGHVYYSQPLYNSQYRIVEQRRVPEKEDPPLQTVPATQGSFTPLQPSEYLCSKPPKVFYNPDGTANIIFDRLPKECQ